MFIIVNYNGGLRSETISHSKERSIEKFVDQTGFSWESWMKYDPNGYVCRVSECEIMSGVVTFTEILAELAEQTLMRETRWEIGEYNERVLTRLYGTLVCPLNYLYWCHNGSVTEDWNSPAFQRDLSLTYAEINKFMEIADYAEKMPNERKLLLAATIGMSYEHF